jgi:hypothetical protein
MTTTAKILLIASLSAAFIACKKGQSPAPATVAAKTALLVGTWHVVSDTTKSDWELTNRQNVSVYTGTVSDYYTFNADGTFSLKQGNGSSSGTYSLADRQLSLIDSSQPAGQNTRVLSVTRLTDHAAVFNLGGASPGGSISQTITLSK